MNLIDIENMKAADLKAHKQQAIEAAKGADHADLAGRYVQARLDAVTRDEKLAEQGVTITSLNQAMAQTTAQLTQAVAELKGLQARFEQQKASLAECTQALASERQARALAETLAKARRVAVAEINAIAGKALIDG